MKAFRTVVETPSPTQDLTTLASVKLELGITDTTDDAWLTEQIHQASQQFATMCNRIFGEETLTDRFNTPWCYGGPLILSRIPVTEIISVTEGTTVLSPTDVEFDVESGMLFRHLPNSYIRSHWFGGVVAVTFVAGYQLLGTLPYDVERACNLIIKGRVSARERDPLVRSEAIPGVMSIDYSTGSTASAFDASEIGRLVKDYRMHTFG